MESVSRIVNKKNNHILESYLYIYIYIYFFLDVDEIEVWMIGTFYCKKKISLINFKFD